MCMSYDMSPFFRDQMLNHEMDVGLRSVIGVHPGAPVMHQGGFVFQVKNFFF